MTRRRTDRAASSWWCQCGARNASIWTACKECGAMSSSSGKGSHTNTASENSEHKYAAWLDQPPPMTQAESKERVRAIITMLATMKTPLPDRAATRRKIIAVPIPATVPATDGTMQAFTEVSDGDF